MSDCAGVAQRLKRDPMRFDILDLFDAVGRSRKYVLGSAEDKAEFIQLVDESLTEANTDSMIYGRRTEAMFAYIAASLGKCLLIKKKIQEMFFPTMWTSFYPTIGLFWRMEVK